MKNVREASDANAADPAKAGLEKSGIAGTEPEDKEGKDKEKEKEGGKEDSAEKKDGEAMEVSERESLVLQGDHTGCVKPPR